MVWSGFWGGTIWAEIAAGSLSETERLREQPGWFVAGRQQPAPKSPDARIYRVAGLPHHSSLERGQRYNHLEQWWRGLADPAVPPAIAAVTVVARGLAGIVPQALGGHINAGTRWEQELND